MRLSRNFVLSEVSCPCGKCETTVEDINMRLIQQLQRLRDAFGLPIRINSGYRCPEHNEAIGGSERSQHVLGKAVDIDLSTYGGHDKHRLLRLIYASGSFTGVGIYPTFVHVDVRDVENEVTWLGK